MVHFIGQHDPKAEPVRLHADYDNSIAALHDKIAALHEKFDELIAVLRDANAPKKDAA